MTLPVVLRRALIWLPACLLLAGCDGIWSGGDDEARNALLAEARTKKLDRDYAGSVALLEKALEANPRLARAHWELGLIYSNSDGNTPADLQDYVFAIYHFRKLLQIEPNWKQAESVNDCIRSWTLELAKTAPVGPPTTASERLVSQLTTSVHKLDAEKRLMQEALNQSQLQLQKFQNENAQLRASLLRLQPPPPAPVAPGGSPARSLSNALPPRPLGASNPAPPGLNPGPRPLAGTNLPASSRATARAAPPAAAAAPRVYRVKAGDTLSAIARAHKLKVSDLQTANPGVDSRHLQVGMELKLPAR
jgi:tetratricopeptide (TPR) repeat protein